MIAEADAITFAARIMGCVDDLWRNRDTAMIVLGGKRYRWNGQSCYYGDGNEMPA